MFQVSLISLHTSAQPSASLVIYLVDDTLLQAMTMQQSGVASDQRRLAVDTLLVMPQTLQSTGFRSEVYSGATGLRQKSAVSRIFLLYISGWNPRIPPGPLWVIIFSKLLTLVALSPT